MIGVLVDDDPIYLEVLSRALARRGLRCSTASDAQQALRLVRELQPDFALLDLKLAETSGIELIRPLREIRPDMRILVVTGYASIATAVGAIKLGADDYLPKPVSADVLLSALSGGRRSQTSATAVAPTMIPLHRLEWEHIQQALAETGGNVSAAARLLGMHRRTLQRKLGKRPGRERSATDRLMQSVPPTASGSPATAACCRLNPECHVRK